MLRGIGVETSPTIVENRCAAAALPMETEFASGSSANTYLIWESGFFSAIPSTPWIAELARDLCARFAACKCASHILVPVGHILSSNN